MAVKQVSLEKEYAKKTGNTPEDIKKLRHWLDTQPHLPKDHITDLDLILAYHCCCQSQEVAKQVLDLNLTLKTLFTTFFKDRVLDEEIESILHVILPVVLPTRTREGYRILYCTMLDADPKKFVLSTVVRSVFMVTDLYQYEDGTSPGDILIIDMMNVKLGHLTKLDLHILQQCIYYLQEALLLKIQGIHFTNAPSFMDRLMMIIKPFLKKNLLDLIKIHQIGAQTLFEYLPQEALPKEAGGESKTCKEFRDETIAKLKANKEFFVAENKKRVVESLRPGKPKTISDIFGSIEGSFKKLEID